VGGGESRLVDALLARGVTCIGVLDVAVPALHRAQARLGEKAADVAWIQADVTGVWSWKDVDIWHDRAVFHFLTERADRDRYKARLAEMLKRGGSAIIATFALDGPEKCSGLPVVRYSPETLSSELGDGFVLVDSRLHSHTTPWGTTQAFQYSRFNKTLALSLGGSDEFRGRLDTDAVSQRREKVTAIIGHDDGRAGGASRFSNMCVVDTATCYSIAGRCLQHPESSRLRQIVNGEP
jgi:methyltransferase family protein